MPDFEEYLYTHMHALVPSRQQFRLDFQMLGSQRDSASVYCFLGVNLARTSSSTAADIRVESGTMLMGGPEMGNKQDISRSLFHATKTLGHLKNLIHICIMHHA